MVKNNIAQIVESWGPAIKQLTNNTVKDSNYEKFAWMCEYAHNHTMAKLNDTGVYQLTNKNWAFRYTITADGRKKDVRKANAWQPCQPVPHRWGQNPCLPCQNWPWCR